MAVVTLHNKHLDPSQASLPSGNRGELYAKASHLRSELKLLLERDPVLRALAEYSTKNGGQVIAISPTWSRSINDETLVLKNGNIKVREERYDMAYGAHSADRRLWRSSLGRAVQAGLTIETVVEHAREVACKLVGIKNSSDTSQEEVIESLNRLAES